MKKIKDLVLALLAVAMLSSCMSDGNSYAGFFGVNANGGRPVYANTAYAFLTFGSYGAWHIDQESGADWCKLDLMQGNGGAFYSIPARFTLNTTGESRVARFVVRDNSNGDDAYGTFYFSQYATRGDGSLGNASLVTGISGDDGSAITIEYDTLCRPTLLVMEKNGEQLRRLTIGYHTSDSTVSVSDGSSTLTGVYDLGYQTDRLQSDRDTVGYYEQSIFAGDADAFNVEEHKWGGEYTVQALLYTNGSLRDGNPDGEYVADSLRYQRGNAEGIVYREMLKLSYSDNSNRCQSVDVNQLLLGIEECNPYQLVAMFRDARNSKIISEASAADGKFVVEATLNSDKSVSTMTVTNKQGAKVKYTFTYSSTLP
jgi:hypothetical protein